MSRSSEYSYRGSEPSHVSTYLWPVVYEILKSHFENRNREQRVFDLGCGNGSFASWLRDKNMEVVGVDPSTSGIEEARKAHPELSVYVGSSEDDLGNRFGQFPVVVSLEVIEHVYDPREFMDCVSELLEPRGMLVLSTPYHGYLKNLALALTGKMDAHFTALWDHGHIKFWSIPTMQELLIEFGFSAIQFRRVGRIPPLAKSMVVAAIRGRC